MLVGGKKRRAGCSFHFKSNQSRTKKTQGFMFTGCSTAVPVLITHCLNIFLTGALCIVYARRTTCIWQMQTLLSVYCTCVPVRLRFVSLSSLFCLCCRGDLSALTCVVECGSQSFFLLYLWVLAVCIQLQKLNLNILPWSSRIIQVTGSHLFVWV